MQWELFLIASKLGMEVLSSVKADRQVDREKGTQKLPHDGIGLLESFSSVGGVKQQPINDVNLLLVLLSSENTTKGNSHMQYVCVL